MKTVWRCAIDIDYTNYENLKERKVVAQGWKTLRDLSDLEKIADWNEFVKKMDDKINESEVPSYHDLETPDGKIEYKKECAKIKETFYNLLHNIKCGNLVIGTEKHTPKGICEITNQSHYFYDPAHDYANCLGPVEWHDLEIVGKVLNINNILELLGYSRPPGPLKRDKKHKKEINEIWGLYISKLKEERLMRQILELITNKKQLILTGPPGTGKTYTAKEIVKHILCTEKLEEVAFSNKNGGNHKGAYALVQFHPSYSYEDFIQGIVATAKGEQIEYAVKDKILLEMVKAAKDNKGKKFILIIDEINRANLPAVLGELIYSLEYRNEKVDLLYGKYNEGHSDDSFSKTVSLPDNLYIIGTMNTADRSIGHIDYAIRRRFVFISLDSMEPKDERIHDLVRVWYQEVYNLFKRDKISPDFEPDDVRIGHSYFMLDEKDDKDKAGEILAGKFAFQVLPLLKEYYKDGIFRNNNEIKLNIDGYTKEIDIKKSIYYQKIYNDLSDYLKETGKKEPNSDSSTEGQSEKAENNGSDTVDE